MVDMYVLDKQGAQWTIDEGLRFQAQKLIDNFPDLVGHVNLDQVIFLRLSGGKANWLGKCFFIGKAPMNIIPKFVVGKLASFGMADITQLYGLDSDLFDIRFIIAINDDAINSSNGDLKKIEDITLVHELMHISEDGEKLVKHDIQDFKVLVAEFGPYWTNGIFNNSEDLVLPDGYKSGTAETWSPEESN